MNRTIASRYGWMMYPDKDAYVGRSLEIYGEYSFFEAEFLKILLRPGHIAIDVGANIGSLTVPMARRVGVKGRVYAFEPQEWLYYSLCGNIFSNNLTNTICRMESVSDVQGEAKFPIIDYEKNGNFGNVKSSSEGFPVRQTTIDSLQLPNVNLIKIDVEGSEDKVLLGAVETIERLKPYLYFECSGAEAVEQHLKFLSEFGYDAWLHRPFLYNPNNFFHNEENVFCHNGLDIVSINIFGYHIEESSKWSTVLSKQPQFTPLAVYKPS